MPSPSAADLAASCEGSRKDGDGWRAKCPLHNGTSSTSLHLNDTPEGFVLLHCFGGCDQEALCAYFGIRYEPPAREISRNGQKHITHLYDYHDAEGNVLFQTVRYEPKDFRQRRPDPEHPGAWLWNLKDTPLVLYHLPQVLTADTVCLVEGEKDADTLCALGLTATTAPLGAKKWRPQYTETLRGKEVIVFHDNDQPGKEYLEDITRALHDVARVKCPVLPDLPPKGDISWWLTHGGNVDALQDIISNTTLYARKELREEKSAFDDEEAPSSLPPRMPYRPPPLCPQLPPGSACIASSTGAAPWLEAYIAHSRQWSPRGLQMAHEAVGLWVLSTIAARRVFCQVGSSTVYPVLFLAMVARSTLYAKSTTATLGRDVLRRAGCSFLLTADRTTPQALLKSMAGFVSPRYGAMSEEQQEETRRRLAFAGQRGAYFEEWGGMLHQMRRTDSPMAEFHALLRVLDDNQMHYSSDTISRGLEDIQQPYLALLSSATPHDLAPFMAPGSAWWHDGFWPRFVFLSPGEEETASITQRPRTGYTVPGSLLLPLHDWHTRLGVPAVTVEEVMDPKGKPTGIYQATIGALPQHEIQITPAVYDAYEAYNTGLLTLIRAGDIATDLDASYGRFHEKALRVALLLASSAGDATIGLHHWACAQGITERWRRGLHTLAESLRTSHPLSADEQHEAKITAYLERVGQATARDIRLFTHVGPSHLLGKLLEGMVRQGMVMKEKQGKKMLYGLLPFENDTPLDDDFPPF